MRTAKLSFQTNSSRSFHHHYITMTGIDQEMMQKSLSVTKLKDSQKNMVVLGIILVGVISLFLFMGGLLHLYGTTEHVASSGDQLFPDIALNHMPPFISIIFIIALISALFPSADGAMTALTSSLCIDIFGLKEKNISEKEKENSEKNSLNCRFCIFDDGCNF